jgi:hypothetical protein
MGGIETERKPEQTASKSDFTGVACLKTRRQCPDTKRVGTIAMKHLSGFTRA